MDLHGHNAMLNICNLNFRIKPLIMNFMLLHVKQQKRILFDIVEDKISANETSLLKLS
ncbi:hypothetical protein BKA69DRAFT_1104506 [Paraphysoderma sedebokerense]|nr:hypothetical protein BKA69DRAFT_1104506 [Paraphysoderma sedebokerense]